MIMKKKKYIIDRYTVEVINDINNKTDLNVDIISIYTDFKGKQYIIEGKTADDGVIMLYIPFSLVSLL